MNLFFINDYNRKSYCAFDDVFLFTESAWVFELSHSDWTKPYWHREVCVNISNNIIEPINAEINSTFSNTFIMDVIYLDLSPFQSGLNDEVPSRFGFSRIISFAKKNYLDIYIWFSKSNLIMYAKVKNYTYRFLKRSVLGENYS